MKKILTGAIAMILLACTTSNPLLEQPKNGYGIPAFDQVKPEHYLPAFEAAIAEQKAEIDAIVNNPIDILDIVENGIRIS